MKEKNLVMRNLSADVSKAAELDGLAWRKDGAIFEMPVRAVIRSSRWIAAVLLACSMCIVRELSSSSSAMCVVFCPASCALGWMWEEHGKLHHKRGAQPTFDVGFVPPTRIQPPNARQQASPIVDVKLDHGRGGLPLDRNNVPEHPDLLHSPAHRERQDVWRLGIDRLQPFQGHHGEANV